MKYILWSILGIGFLVYFLWIKKLGDDAASRLVEILTRKKSKK